MAKTSQVNRNAMRERLAKRDKAKRGALKAIVMDRTLPVEERFNATLKLAHSFAPALGVDEIQVLWPVACVRCDAQQRPARDGALQPGADARFVHRREQALVRAQIRPADGARRATFARDDAKARQRHPQLAQVVNQRQQLAKKRVG